MDTITISWNIEDIDTAIQDNGLNVELTHAEKRNVLALCLINHDANEGINWSVIIQGINQIVALRSSTL